MRNEEWLAEFMHSLWEKNFPDVKRKNNIIVRWKGRWKNKFGHIKRLKNKDTEIGINSWFKDKRVPEYIIELTLAHEIVHYMHGFQSPHPKLFRHPHQGGVVDKELKKRGYSVMLKEEKKWFKDVWLREIHKINPEKGKVTVKYLRSSFRFF